MSADRRAEVISGVLVLVLTVLCFWCVRELARLVRPFFENCGCMPPDAWQFVVDGQEDPFSVSLVPWVLGAVLVGAGAFARRWPRANTVGLVALFLGPIAPVAMLAFSAVSARSG